MATAQGGDWRRFFVMKELDDGWWMVSIATFLDNVAIHSIPVDRMRSYVITPSCPQACR